MFKLYSKPMHSVFIFYNLTVGVLGFKTHALLKIFKSSYFLVKTLSNFNFTCT